MSSETSACLPAIGLGGQRDDARERRARRRRTLIVLASISVGWKVLLFTVGAAIPRFLLTDGVGELPAPQRPYATAAITTASALFDLPLERFGRVVQRVRVISVDRVDSGGADDQGDGGGGGHPCAIGARLRAYTYFAIPYSEVRTRCARGVIEYRVVRAWPYSR